jgi:hypothetical protein
MALSTSYRWVSVGKLTIRNHKNAPNRAPRFTLPDLIAALRAVENENAGRRSFHNDDRRMWCKPIGEDDDYFELLMQVGDKKVSDVAFINFDTGRSRNGGKTESEGGHFCSHVIIKKDPDGLGRHLVLVEKVPNIHFSSLKAHFNWVMNSPAHFKVFDADGLAKQYRATTEFDGFQSKTLREAMTTGTLQNIEFVGQERLDEGHDEEDLVRETTHEVKWSIKRRVDADGARRLVSRAFDFMRGWEAVEQDKSQLLVRIKAENGQIRTAAITAEAEESEAAAEEALENAFYLNEFINGFDAPLTQRYDALREDVLRKLKQKAQDLEA